MYFPFTLFTDEICVTQSTKEPVNCAQLLSRNGLQSDLGADLWGSSRHQNHHAVTPFLNRS